MATKMNIILFFIALFGAALQGSSAQTTHLVGGQFWIVPTGGSVVYSTWASSRTFTVGDVLVFNFTAGRHDVAELRNSADYDACNPANPISISTAAPTNITLRTAGPHFYICTVPTHCQSGQKLAINVSSSSTATPPAAATPRPAPSPAPVSAPTPSPRAPPTSAPSPSVTPRTYVVGDALGWTVPTTGLIAYQTWASDKTFRVGDILVFNFANGRHDVAEMTSRTTYDSCSTNSTLTPIMTGPARITLTRPGEHFFICTFGSHCLSGQKLAINVTGTGVTPPPSTPATPRSGSPGPASGPSSTPTAPSTPGVSPPPPPPNSAPSFAGAALPVTLLSIALAFFLY